MNPPQTEENRAEYIELVKRTIVMQLPVSIAREILEQLATRAISTPSLSHFAVEVAWAWFVQNPMTVTVDTLANSWHACFSLRDLKNIEYTMDVSDCFPFIISLSLFTTICDDSNSIHNL